MLMPGVTSTPSALDALRQHFEAALREAAESAIQQAMVEVERQLRERIALTSVRMAQNLRIDTMQNELLIHVRIGDLPR